MPWPASILEQFNAIPAGINGLPNEALFYGSYLTLLAYLFPSTEAYMITPRGMRPPEGCQSPTMVLIVQRNLHPVFFIEIKPPCDDIDHLSYAAADGQMRTEFFNLEDFAELPVMHGVSALGTRLCFYSYTRDTNVLDPPPIPPVVEYTNDVAPAARWNIDVLSDEGVAKMMQVADEVKAMVAQHQWSNIQGKSIWNVT